MDGHLPGPPRRKGRMGHHALASFRRALRQIGPEPLLLLGFMVELGWAFVGSLGFGLRSNGPGGPLQAAVWVGGVVAIALATGAAVYLTAPERRKRD